MTEIVTCVRCGQRVHDPENGRVCAECKAADLEDENREEIESALAYLDALTAIEISALKNDHLQNKTPVLSSWQFNQLEIEGRPDAFYRIRAHVTQAVTV
jgi:hypothetical protein